MALASNKLIATIDAAVAVSASEVEKFVEAARRRLPDMPDSDLIIALERSYTGLVATTGAAAGGVAAAPGVGLASGALAAAADASAFTTATAVYVLGVASVHGIAVEEIERRKALILTVLVGPGGVGVVERIAGRTGAHWGRRVTQAVPLTTIRQINRVLGRNVVTKYGTKQGILVIGKMAPFGFGAAIGAGGNVALARMAVRSTRSAFGPLPSAADEASASK
ncbi:hypothetical protein [Nocardioides houyundeii]|uniref:hypothetical protein n=1 Tax=Nocardioides houyundeii TaxID=2045452 RepID=UPI001315A4CA|nr:hypothetical protein [Nocardioides houyundeii]